MCQVFSSCSHQRKATNTRTWRQWFLQQCEACVRAHNEPVFWTNRSLFPCASHAWSQSSWQSALGLVPMFWCTGCVHHPAFNSAQTATVVLTPSLHHLCAIAFDCAFVNLISIMKHIDLLVFFLTKESIQEESLTNRMQMFDHMIAASCLVCCGLSQPPQVWISKPTLTKRIEYTWGYVWHKDGKFSEFIFLLPTCRNVFQCKTTQSQVKMSRDWLFYYKGPAAHSLLSPVALPELFLHAKCCQH